jgi:transcription elongation GreA/GreB family factor
MSAETLADLERRAAELRSRVQRLALNAATDALDGFVAGDYVLAAHHLAAVRQVLERARIVIPDGCVLLGSRVTFRRTGEAALEESEVEVTAPDVADPTTGRISFESPLGAALLGRRMGETARFMTPAGPRTVIVTAIA